MVRSYGHSLHNRSYDFPLVHFLSRFLPSLGLHFILPISDQDEFPGPSLFAIQELVLCL